MRHHLIPTVRTRQLRPGVRISGSKIHVNLRETRKARGHGTTIRSQPYRLKIDSRTAASPISPAVFCKTASYTALLLAEVAYLGVGKTAASAAWSMGNWGLSIYSTTALEGNEIASNISSVSNITEAVDIAVKTDSFRYTNLLAIGGLASVATNYLISPACEYLFGTSIGQALNKNAQGNDAISIDPTPYTVGLDFVLQSNALHMQAAGSGTSVLQENADNTGSDTSVGKK